MQFARYDKAELRLTGLLEISKRSMNQLHPNETIDERLEEFLLNFHLRKAVVVSLQACRFAFCERRSGICSPEFELWKSKES